MEDTGFRLGHLADFKPPSAARAWVSIPNPNGLPLIATATSEKTVRVYSLSNFTLHSTLEGGHSRSVRSVAWKPSTQNNDELCIATGSFDSTMGLWRRKEDGALGAERSGEPLELEVTRNGIKHDDGGSDDGEDWEFAIVLEGHDSEVKHVAYSPSGQWLASCSRDKSIWIWEEIGEEGDDEFETVAVLQEHSADVKCVSWRAASSYKDEGEVLASASYDDTIRLWREEEEGEWGCFAVMEGHEGTVWSLEWEPLVSIKRFEVEEEGRPPRLLSSSADGTIRLWSLAPAPPSPNKPSYFNSGIPSTMRPAAAAEKWVCTATLPKIHDLPVYSISWSAKSGQVASTGGDGRVVIYEERRKEPTSTETESQLAEITESAEPNAKTEWVVLSVLDGAHGPYEVNHVTWCPRYDAGKKSADEELIITTGDDGLVKAWTVEGNPVEA